MRKGKDLNYYLSLDYNIIIEKRSQEDKIWFIAYCNELGKFACFGRGETIEESISSFKNEKADFIVYLFENKESIPEPIINEDEELLSGVFNVRTSPQLHSLVSQQAKINKQSLNQYVNHLLSRGTAEGNLENLFNSCFNKLERKLDIHHHYVTGKLNYQFIGFQNKDLIDIQKDEHRFSPDYPGFKYKEVS